MSAKKAATSSKNSGSTISVSSLGRWNKWIAVILAVQAAVIIILSAVRSYPVTINYLGVDTLQTQAQGHTVLATGSQKIFDVNLAYIVAAFLLIAAIAHALQATWLRNQYEKDIKNGVNKIRWIAFALSMGTMLMAVGLVVGVQDVASLLMLFGLTAVMYLVYMMAEMRSNGSRNADWPSYIIGCAAGAVSWIAVLKYVIGGAVYGSVPAYVYWITGAAFVLIASFSVNLYLQLRNYGGWQHYLYSERMFMAANLAANTILAWVIFAGCLHP